MKHTFLTIVDHDELVSMFTCSKCISDGQEGIYIMDEGDGTHCDVTLLHDLQEAELYPSCPKHGIDFLFNDIDWPYSVQALSGMWTPEYLEQYREQHSPAS